MIYYHNCLLKINLIFIQIFGILALIVGACSVNSQTSTQVVSSQKKSFSDCPDKPVTSLNSNDVKPIQIGSQTITQTGQVKADKYLGYTFSAKSGQKLTYQTNDDICIWIYAPDNQIITNKNLNQTGTYIIQLSAPQGVRNFELKLSLDISQPSVAPSSASVQTNISTTAIPNPESFIRDHYILLNNREYSKTWNHLSSNFKNQSRNYSEYQQWWNSVREIKIGDIRKIQQSSDTAIVDAELWYVKNDGKSYQDSKNRIYLLWNNVSNNWLLDRKSSP
ncbi:hypothetical protein H6G80_21710 [Nostoc sp. FACHB-87]|uniref:hypothetical protein n=1 Tax=Nostocaceae TaxID=1162 RepID=UPI001685ACC1|nr:MULTISPECIES: hypothetical protein [Nostocaceae]MBD2456683.1 hypothetical protein [Nostoc sp. FACHB-87]MBD2478063.1 hypothetical protein [Anabaena sp. FACHB-83]